MAVSKTKKVLYVAKYSRIDQAKFVEDSFKNLKGYGLLKGCLPQILLGPFLNTLCHIARNNNKVDSVETGRIVFAHLLP